MDLTRFARLIAKHELSSHTFWRSCTCPLAEYLQENEELVYMITDDSKGGHMDGIRLSGDDPDITEDGYRFIFNLEKTKFSKLDDEGKVRRLATLRKAQVRAKVRIHAGYIHLQEILDKATAEERAKLKELDRKYVVKPVERAEKTIKAARAAGKSSDPINAAVKALMVALRITMEEAQGMVNERRKANG